MATKRRSGWSNWETGDSINGMAATAIRCSGLAAKAGLATFPTAAPRWDDVHAAADTLN